MKWQIYREISVTFSSVVHFNFDADSFKELLSTTKHETKPQVLDNVPNRRRPKQSSKVAKRAIIARQDVIFRHKLETSFILFEPFSRLFPKDLNAGLELKNWKDRRFFQVLFFCPLDS